jgi:hypothetical protein
LTGECISLKSGGDKRHLHGICLDTERGTYRSCSIARSRLALVY